MSPIAKMPGTRGGAGRRIDRDMVALEIEAPIARSGRDPSPGRRTAAARRPRGVASLPVEVATMTAESCPPPLPARAADRASTSSMLPSLGQPLQLRRRIPARRGISARRWTTVTRVGDLGQRQRPVDRRIAAAGDDDALAAEILAPVHQVEDALALELRDAVERRAVRAERAGAGGDHHRAARDALARPGLEEKPLAARRQSLSTCWPR